MSLNDKLSIWQQNVNKLPTCQHDLVSNNELTLMKIDILALQEPAINAFNCSVASREWTPVYPMAHKDTPSKTRSLLLVRLQVSTDTWNQIDFPSGDVMVIQFNGNWGKLTLFNIYNEGNNNETISLLTKFHHKNRTLLGQGEGNAHIIWLSDFNRHHPHWDDPNDTRLFTGEAVKDAEVLIEVVAEVGLDLALLSSIPMHLHNVTKKWSRLDQVFLSDHSENLLIACNTETEHRGINTDCWRSHL
jgi:hypothetical protein